MSAESSPSGMPSPSSTRLSPMLTVLLALAAAVVALAGISYARDIVGPLALAVVLVVICHPVRHPLERAGWPRWLATTAVITLAYLILVVMGLLLTLAGVQFVQLVVDFSDEIVSSVADLSTWLTTLGVDPGVIDRTVESFDPTALVGYATSLGTTVIGILTALFLVFAYIIFMAVDGARYAQAERNFGPGAAAPMVRIGNLFSGTRRFYVVNAIFGAVVAVIDGVALAAVGVPAPLVWAILSFVTNFIPNIGFVLGLVPPAILALVVGGPPLMLAVVAIYCVANVVLQVLIQPKFVSDAVSLSLTLSFFSVIFWTFIIGPLGAILSIPLTLLVRALVLEADPRARWLRWLSGDVSAGRTDDEESPPVI